MLDHLIVHGDITQLEWVDLAARLLPLEGLVFELRHFPRKDQEYLAELKKLCVDRSLTIAAISVEQLFDYEGEVLEAIFDIASEIGAPLILTDPPQPNSEVPAYAWREAAQHGKAVARVAKRQNITIGVRNVQRSLCPGVSELKRLTKEIDSAWIRFAPEATTLSAEDLIALRTRSVIVTIREAVIPVLESDRRGFLVLEVQLPQLGISELVAMIRDYAAKLRRSSESVPTL